MLAACGRRDRRQGALSARFMVYFTLALALFHQDSYDDVAENLVGALPDMGDDIPNRASFTRARQRLGPRPLEAVFRAVAGPAAPSGLTAAFYRGCAWPRWTGSCWTCPTPRPTGVPSAGPATRAATTRGSRRRGW
ncbi:hypothetical protein ALI22I_08560 [Saccharothrix sp. ALI-22-I]|uniref:transposase domain-containing protein n=1 Tax=Saccharothrix sp. ALI-22-I TaxID=1933778 RepID=UPI00097C5B64|nr:transposase domain-containing protein [Saccharothrix sp. ALI-22-I]ONI91406.1 hypothetical protein ALI22I_08560 [Saccharothrix sp. ALI-22-I]